MKTIYPIAAGLGLMLAACSESASEQNNAVEQRASALQPGEYEIVAKVESLRSTDGTTPASALKEGGDPVTTRTCVGADNAIEPSAFVESNETCSGEDVYVRNGRLNMQLRCNRPGHGSITHTVDGDFTADSFSGTVTSGTYFSGSGDYEMTRSITAKRVGECTAQAG